MLMEWVVKVWCCLWWCDVVCDGVDGGASGNEVNGRWNDWFYALHWNYLYSKFLFESNHAIAEILLSVAHKNFSWNQTTKSVYKVSLYCSVQYLVHLMRTDSMKITVTTVQTGFDQTISSLDNQQRVGQNEVTTAMKLLKKCSGREYFTK